jgi:hypothetical protein
MRHILCSTVGFAAWALFSPLAVNLRANEVEGKDVRPSDETIAVQYSRAYLRLCEIELKKALATEKKAPRTVTPIVFERLRMNVNVAEAQLQETLHPTSSGKMQLHLRYAEEQARIAAMDFAQAERISNLNPKVISDLDLERLRLTSEVARLRLALFREPAYLPSLLDQMQWQIDRLSEEILQLHKLTHKLQ